jgi:hypothetical protein
LGRKHLDRVRANAVRDFKPSAVRVSPTCDSGYVPACGVDDLPCSNFYEGFVGCDLNDF